MAFDAFLKLAGIKDESTDFRHKDEIEVLSFSFGISNKVSPTGGGGGAGKPTVLGRLGPDPGRAAPGFPPPETVPRPWREPPTSVHNACPWP